MHALLSDRARRRASLKRFVRTYRQAAETLTLSKVRADTPRRADDEAYDLPVRMQTRIFGRLSGNVRLPMIEEEDGASVDWRSQLVFPGLRAGEKLQRETTLAARGAILARDGTPLAKGPDRLSDLGPLAAEVAGRVGPAPPERADELARRGVPEGAPVGLNGLEREFDERLSGTPGRRPARRLAGHRARRAARRRRRALRDRPRHPARRGRGARGPLRRHRRAAARHRRGARALGHRVLRSPAARLDVQDRHARRRARGEGGQGGGNSRSRRRPRSRASSSANAHGEACGGSLKQAFADSCNSVFAPLGAKLGAEKLVETAERFGFNQDPGPAGAARSTIPAAEEIGDDLAVGSSAIGQGKVRPDATAPDAAHARARGARPRRAHHRPRDGLHGRRAGQHRRHAAGARRAAGHHQGVATRVDDDGVSPRFEPSRQSSPSPSWSCSPSVPSTTGRRCLATSA